MSSPLPRILIVDDEPSVRSAIRDFLSGEGYEVLEAQDGVSMHRALLENNVGIVLLDVMLSGESGLSLAQALRERDDVGLIMISALGAETDRDRHRHGQHAGVLGAEEGDAEARPGIGNDQKALA
ncbi:MAG: response regulator, partial [Novosphingobium sp.]|nr:response regulator [Novosphingobium sp.]